MWSLMSLKGPMKLSPKTNSVAVGRPWMGAQSARRKTGFLVRESKAVFWIRMTTRSGSSLGAVETDAESNLVEVEDARDGSVVLGVEAVLGLASRRRRWGGTYLATAGMSSAW